MRLGPTRVKRSTIFSASLCGIPLMRPDAALVAIQFRSLKFVVSTTSVSPSQRPRESPSTRRTVGGRCGRPSSGMIARVVDHLGVNHDVAARLDDLVGVVVAGRE